MLTKQQERDLVNQMVENTPPGYVRDLLKEAAPLWMRAIDNDLCVVGLNDLWERKSELETEIQTAQRQLIELGNQKALLQRQRNDLVETLQGVSDRLATSISIARKSMVNP